MIQVVSAMVVQDRRLLLTQRTRWDQHHPLRWETPGGKVESEESHHEALRRELREELGVEVASINDHPVWAGAVARPGREDVFLTLYWTELAGTPRPAEGQGMGWFTESEFIGLGANLMPGNEKAFSCMVAYLDRAKWGEL